MPLLLGTPTVLREDLVVIPCTFTAQGAHIDDAVNTTLANGTDFTLRNAGGALTPPVAVMTQLDTQVAASAPVGAVVNANNVVITKSAAQAQAGNGAASSFRLYIFGPKSKGMG
jgi:hypothetical protein